MGAGAAINRTIFNRYLLLIFTSELFAQWMRWKTKENHGEPFGIMGEGIAGAHQ